MPKRPYDLLSLSILILSLGFCSALVAIGSIRLLEIAPHITALMGLWLLALSAIQKGEGGSLPFDTFSWGLIPVTGGVMGFPYLRDMYTAFFIPPILIVIGLIGIVPTLRSTR
jgi:hypothetical protein